MDEVDVICLIGGRECLVARIPDADLNQAAAMLERHGVEHGWGSIADEGRIRRVLYVDRFLQDWAWPPCMSLGTLDAVLTRFDAEALRAAFTLGGRSAVKEMLLQYAHETLQAIGKRFTWLDE